METSKIVIPVVLPRTCPDEIACLIDDVLREHWAERRADYETELGCALNPEEARATNIFPDMVRIHNWLHPEEQLNPDDLPETPEDE